MSFNNDRESTGSDIWGRQGKRRISFRDSTALYGRGSMDPDHTDAYYYYQEDEELMSNKRRRYSSMGSISSLGSRRRTSAGSAISSSPSTTSSPLLGGRQIVSETRLALMESNRQLASAASSPPERDLAWEVAMQRQFLYQIRSMDEARASLEQLPDRLEQILSGGKRKSSSSSEVRSQGLSISLYI